MSAFPVYDDRYIKTKIRTYGNKVYTNFCSLCVPENVDSLLVYEDKYFLQIYLHDCADKTVDKLVIVYLDDNLFESDEN